MIIEITVKTKEGQTFKCNSMSEVIRIAREASGLTQEQASSSVDIKVQSWQKYEYGERSPKDDMLEKIAETLNIQLTVLKTFNAI